ncbi:MAG TPA: AarF/UbiB family protein [Thermomonas sp.]|nr:AarF/UbiB family protein [Thermomonas sp.]
MTDAPATGFARTARIVGFLLKYRNAGVFSGLDVDASQAAELPADGRPEEFVDDLEALGPTFVKIGQALSTRPDMVPPAYLAALERMQDDVAPVPFEDIRVVLEEELGVKLGKLFDSFEETPLGGASLAQVHRARLRDGRAVAVKVQRPGIEESIHADLDALASLAGKADRFTDVGRRTRFADWVHEFRRSLLAELDYRSEADNLVRFGAHFERYPELFVPQPVWDLCRRRVLTMELVDGTKATDLGGLRRTEQSMAPLAEAVMRGYLDQAFIHGEIHADPHPGNLLVTNDGRIALLDLGMVAHVPPRQRERLLKLLFAAVDGRGEEVANEAIAMSTRLDDFDEERYLREVGQMVARYAATSAGNAQSEGRLVLDLTLLGAACGLRTPPELSLLGKTLLNLDAVSRALDPQMDVKAVVEDHLEHVMRERLKQSFSPARLASEAMEVQALVREAPRKLGDILGLLAENRLQVRMTGLDDSQLMENVQKIANRVSTGIIVAALIMASALLMRVEGGPRLLGYPALALLLFSVAALLGLGIVASALLRDRKARPQETRGPR